MGLSKPSGPAAAECVDVGLFVKDCESEQEVAQKLQELPQEKKYALLTQHKRPPQGFQFPTTFVGGCNRSFRPSWLSDHRWLAYSTQLDGAFCVPCALFNGSGVKGRLQLGKLVTRPFRAWQKMSEKFAEHQSTKYHQACMELADDLKRRIEHPQQALPVLLDQRRAENIEKNRAIVKSLARAVLFCGRQCIALRGGSEQLDTPGNPGNFLALVRLLSEASSPEDYFRKSVAIPLLDHILSTLEAQFSKAAAVASSLLGVVPSVCCSSEIDLDEALQKYGQDLPSPELFAAEFSRWKRRFRDQPVDKLPASPAEAIKVCDRDMFPNVSVLLQLACTIPVTSCECERSASALRRLHNYMRATMGKERLSSLALLHIHYDRKINLDSAVDIFARLHPRRLELHSIITPVDNE